MPNTDILDTTKVFDYRDLTDRNGKPLRHGIFVHRRKYQVGDFVADWIFTSRNEVPDKVVANAVVIVAKVGDKVLVTDEFRVPLNAREYGFPAGLCEPGQSIYQNAVRELREETGLWATKVFPQLTSGRLVSSAGLSDEAVRIVFVEAEGEVSTTLNEPGENIHAELLDYDQVMALFNGRGGHRQLLSSKAWGLFYAWFLSGNLDFVRPEYYLAGTGVLWHNKGTDEESFVLEGLDQENS